MPFAALITIQPLPPPLPPTLFQQSYARPRPRAGTLAFGLCGGVDEGSKPIFSTRKSSSHLDQSTGSNVHSNFRNHPCFSHSTLYSKWYVGQLRTRRRLLGPIKRLANYQYRPQCETNWGKWQLMKYKWKGSWPSLRGSWGLSWQYKIFLSCPGGSSQPSTKIIISSPHTVSGHAVLPGRLSLNMWLWCTLQVKWVYRYTSLI